MFIRVALLLLLANTLLIESGKIEKTLKNVGKRGVFTNPVDHFDRYKKKELRELDYGFTSAGTYKRFSEEKVLFAKNRTAYEIMMQFIIASSASNVGFKEAIKRIENRMLPDFVGEVCGDDKKMNKYQYLKFLTQNGALYFPTFNYSEQYSILKTDRYVNEFYFTIHQRDTMSVDTKIEFDITMNATYDDNRIFHISHILQGGDCPDIGKVSHSNRDSLDLIIDDIEGINEHNRAKMFLDLFTPQPWQHDSHDLNDLPTTWFYKLSRDESKIVVCQEGVTDVVEYTFPQFVSWYFRFGVMWHRESKMDPKDAFKLSLSQFDDRDIVGRITMKLQMGVNPDAPIRDWNLKFSGKNKGNDSWYINRVEVLCNPEVKYKYESLAAIRDMVVREFVDYVEETNVTQWYSTVDFVKEFAKNGQVKFLHCDGKNDSMTTQLELFTFDMMQKYSTRFTKYSVEKTEIPTPAPDTHEFRFKTMSQAVTENPEFEYEHEWAVYFKWDQMDQFYHIEKLRMECGKEFKNGVNTGIDYYIPINFGGKK